MSAASVVEVKDLKKHFTVRRGMFASAKVYAVDGISFSIKPGETLGLVGEFWLRQVHSRQADPQAYRADGRPSPARRRAHR